MYDSTRFRNNPRAFPAARATGAAIAYAMAPAVVLIGVLAGHVRGAVQLASFLNIVGVAVIAATYLLADALGCYLPGLTFLVALPAGALCWSNHRDWVQGVGVTVVVASCSAIIQGIYRWGSIHFGQRPNLLAMIGRSLATMTWLR